MSVQDLYVLPEDVHITPVADLPEGARSNFTYEENDFVITYSNARNTSKVIDASSASLIKAFRTPRSMPEGVFTYSRINKLNADDVLNEAYSFLVRLRSEGFLVLYETEKEKKKISFRSGDFFEGYEVITKLQGVTDTEIYKLKKNEQQYALKLLKSSALSHHFFNETDVLQHLDGSINPSLIQQGEHNGNPYLITEWVDGIVCTDWAEEHRNIGNEENLRQMLALCCNILHAYAHLHRQGVVHADIHPNNILVTETNEIVLIDFGLSRIVSKENYCGRGGVGFFYEPEYAEAIVNKTLQPMASFSGEQYALAALLYLLFTGKQYLNFSYEKDALFNQILAEPPVAFTHMDIYTDAPVEAVLHKALAKQADDRYATVQDFCAAFTEIITSRGHKKTYQSQHSFSAFSDTLIQKYGFGSQLMETGLQMAPVSSVNFGAAGIAYLFYRMALTQSDAQLMAVADVWANKACNYQQHGDAAFYSKEIDITPATVGKVSIYHTASGAHLVQALISSQMYDYNTHYKSVLQFIQTASQRCENLDVTLGKSSVLIGCSLLHKHLLSGNEMVKTQLLRFGNTTLQNIWNTIDGYDKIGTQTPIDYYGIAHGWAGILYATLVWCEASSQPLPLPFFERVEQLLSIKIEEENYVRWPLSLTENASWPGWCHGSAGYTFLWSALYRFTGNKTFLQTAEKSVSHFLSANKEGTLANLCCGRSGEAYALLNLYNATQNDFYYKSAKALAKAMLPQAHGNQMRNHSLYKGDIGLGILATEIEFPSFARMPFFEI